MSVDAIMAECAIPMGTVHALKDTLLHTVSTLFKNSLLILLSLRAILKILLLRLNLLLKSKP